MKRPWVHMSSTSRSPLPPPSPPAPSMQEMFNKDLEEIKKSQLKMNNAINEVKNTLEGTNSRITETEDKIIEVEYKMVEINEAERKKEKIIKRNEDNLRDLRDNVKRPNIQIKGVPEEEDKKEAMRNKIGWNNSLDLYKHLTTH